MRARAAGLLVPLVLVAGAAAPSRQQAAPPIAPAVEMTTYQIAFLREVAVRNPPDPAAFAALQQAHLDHLARLNRARVNLLYGPFTAPTSNLRGFLILDVPDAAAAKRALADDPFVKAGLMTVDVKPWYGPKNWFHLPDDPATPEPFVFGLLVRASTAPQTYAEGERLQAGHLAYMETLHAQGALPLAGPFGDDGAWRGLVIYRVGTVAEAQALAAKDPLVAAGRLRLEAQPWMTFKGMLK